MLSSRWQVDFTKITLKSIHCTVIDVILNRCTCSTGISETISYIHSQFGPKYSVKITVLTRNRKAIHLVERRNRNWDREIVGAMEKPTSLGVERWSNTSWMQQKVCGHRWAPWLDLAPRGYTLYWDGLDGWRQIDTECIHSKKQVDQDSFSEIWDISRI